MRMVPWNLAYWWPSPTLHLVHTYFKSINPLTKLPRKGTPKVEIILATEYPQSESTVDKIEKQPINE